MLRSEKYLFAVLFLLLAYPAWIRGGTYVPIQWPLPLLGLLVFVFLFLSPYLDFTGEAGRRQSIELFMRVRRDPVFLLGFAFILLLIVQWANAGRVLIYDDHLGKWTYSSPPVPFLPSAVTRPEALEMIWWFFPAWAAVTAVRAQVLDRRATRFLLYSLVINTALLSVFGLIQFVTETDRIYWLWPIDAEFFASFGYANHAGSYFLMMMTVAVGLCVFEVTRMDVRKSGRRIVTLLVSSILILGAANMSLCRWVVAVSWFVTGFAGFFAVRWSWRRLTTVGCINLTAGVLAMFCLGYFLVAGLGGKWILIEMHTFGGAHILNWQSWPLWMLVGIWTALGCVAAFLLTQVRGVVDSKATTRFALVVLLALMMFNVMPALGAPGSSSRSNNRTPKTGEFAGRWFQYQAAFSIWKDHPVFGVGGWGYRYFLALYTPESKWNLITPGKANAHCDPLQFLAEFGAVGGGLMLVVMGMMFKPVFSQALWRQRIVLLPLAGVILTWLHSLIDLPFRSPAILYAWLVILASLPIIALQKVPKSEPDTGETHAIRQ